MAGGKEIDTILIVGTASMIALALFIIVFVVAYQRRLFAKQKEINHLEMGVQKELMEAVILTKEKEQKRMAQELHDGIGSALTALKMSLIQMNLEAEDKKRIDDNIKSISSDVRRISNELMPSVLEDMGLQTAMEKLCIRIEESANIECVFTKEDTFEDLHDEQSQLALYRVVQEILNNIVKYAKATTVTVREFERNNRYILEIRDNGSGFSPSKADLAKPGSLGLKNIRSRIQQVGGTIEYEKLPSKGTLVNIEIPIYEKD